jgi:hypothetical protein
MDCPSRDGRPSFLQFDDKPSNSAQVLIATCSAGVKWYGGVRFIKEVKE